MDGYFFITRELTRDLSNKLTDESKHLRRLKMTNLDCWSDSFDQI